MDTHSDARGQALLGLLVRVAVASNLATSLESAAQIAIDAICDVTGWHVGHLYVLDGANHDSLVPTKVWRCGDADRYRAFREITEATVLSRGVGLPGRVLVSREPLWIADVTRDANFPRARTAVDIGIRAAFGFPILSGAEVLGVLEFFHRDAMEQDAALLTVLAQVGTQLGRVAERVRAEEALRGSETRFRALAQSAVDAIITADHHGRITFWNDSAERVFGYTRHEILGQPLLVLMPERFREAHSRGVQRVTHGGPTAVIGRTVELAGVRKNGEEFPLELSLSTWRSGPHAQDSYFTGIIRDISERKQLEGTLRDTEHALRQAAKMEGLGRLAGGIAHDFNNLLTVIGGYVEMLGHESLPQNAGRMLGHIARSTARASELTKRLLAFSRKQILQPTIVDLGKLAGEIGDMIRRLVGEDIDVTVSVEQGLWLVKVDPNQTEQIMLNLAVNARDAMPDGGHLTINIRNHRADGRSHSSGLRLPAGEYALIEFTDTGVGMSAATRSRVFEPFFTTKPPDKGTGLGLAMAYGFVKQSGGYIDVESEEGRGTKFLIYLPHAEGAEPASRPAGPIESVGGPETVLVVEDERGVRQLVVDALAKAGYDVLSARDAAEARRLSDARSGEIDLIIADVVMPDISGPKLVEEIAGQQPRMRALYISGYTDDEIVRRGVEKGSLAFLHKPFSVHTLLGRVRQVLDADRSA